VPPPEEVFVPSKRAARQSEQGSVIRDSQAAPSDDIVELRAQFELAQARLRQYDDRVGQLHERLEQGERLKAEFVATMSHELRTPLNVVLGFASLLADEAFGALNKDQAEACQKVLESSERLAVLVNDLLDVGRLEAGTLPFHFGPVDVASVVHDVVDHMRPIATQKSLELKLELAEDVPELTADGDRLRQILAHLLDNALKFTDQGGQVGVRTRYDRLSEAVTIDVWDTGIGIPAEAMHRLFERFYQVDSSNTRLYGGTGLGLAVVKEFAERHGGRVSVESKKGDGSTFSLLLPVNGSLGSHEMLIS